MFLDFPKIHFPAVDEWGTRINGVQRGEGRGFCGDDADCDGDEKACK